MSDLEDRCIDGNLPSCPKCRDVLYWRDLPMFIGARRAVACGNGYETYRNGEFGEWACGWRGEIERLDDGAVRVLGSAEEDGL